MGGGQTGRPRGGICGGRREKGGGGRFSGTFGEHLGKEANSLVKRIGVPRNLHSQSWGENEHAGLLGRESRPEGGMGE
jgi:hypothetical protein